jgi:predicted tellurium resistance membrane protein TerC
MSLDNAIAMAAAAKGDMTLISIGLVVSVPIIMLGATVIASVLDRFPWVGMIGAGLIGWIAGGVIADDGRVEQLDGAGHFVEVVQPGTTAAWLDSFMPEAEMTCSAIGAAVVLLIGLYLAKRNAPSADKT